MHYNAFYWSARGLAESTEWHLRSDRSNLANEGPPACLIYATLEIRFLESGMAKTWPKEQLCSLHQCLKLGDCCHWHVLK